MEKIQYVDIRKMKVDDVSMTMNLYEYLSNDEYVVSILPHIENQFDRSCMTKVKSHSIIVTSIYLMEKFSVFIDLPNSKVFFNSDNKEYYTEYENDSQLYSILNFFFHSLSRHYEDECDEFRVSSRIIMDHLDKYENKPLSKIWYDILDFSKKYFREIK